MRIGIMGGTFDPIHYGHLVAAEEARYRFDLERVIFVPCRNPVHKKPYDVSPAEHRYAMVVLAVASNEFFHASRIELDRSGPSYAIDTIREFRCQFGNHHNLYFITGADAVLEIFTWKESEELVRLCRFIAVTRPGYELTALEKRLASKYLKSIEILQIPGIDISSTQIRQRVRQKEPIKYLTPDEVCDYILKHKLYQ